MVNHKSCLKANSWICYCWQREYLGTNLNFFFWKKQTSGGRLFSNSYDMYVTFFQQCRGTTIFTWRLKFIFYNKHLYSRSFGFKLFSETTSEICITIRHTRRFKPPVINIPSIGWVVNKIISIIQFIQHLQVENTFSITNGKIL